jgi:pyruvate formate lyase activating enzyme
MLHEAMLYEKLEDGKVRCNLCPHRCLILPGRKGICAVRENQDGTLYTLVYGQAVAAHVDPIEKKPLYHFLPGTTIFSFATIGCNFRCGFCQNYDISQAARGENGLILGQSLPPELIVENTLSHGCQSIAYTYTEPTIFFEYAYDTAVLAHEKGLKNVFVTNGYMTEEALQTISPYLDAANVDLKSFDDRFYRELCGGTLQPVLDTIRRMHELGIWVEVTTLVIPGKNDGEEELRQIAEFLVGVNPKLPWHVSRFHPDYKLRDRGPTPVQTIERAAEIGYQAGLHYVYAGNVPGSSYESTICPNCQQMVIQRWGYRTKLMLSRGDRCPGCGERIALVLA